MNTNSYKSNVGNSEGQPAGGAADKIRDRLNNYRKLARDLRNQRQRYDRADPEATLHLREIAEDMAAKEITEAEEYKALSELIQRVEDPDQRATLQLRYLDNSEWPDVNFAMFGDLADFNAKERAYQRRVYRIHSRALLTLAQIADVEA